MTKKFVGPDQAAFRKWWKEHAPKSLMTPKDRSIWRVCFDAAFRSGWAAGHNYCLEFTKEKP